MTPSKFNFIGRTYFFTAILTILLMVKATAGTLSTSWVGGSFPSPNSWNNGNNWSLGVTPGPSDNVTIPNTAFNPMLDVTTTIGSLTMGQPNAGLTLDGIHNLTVAGNVNIMPTAWILTGRSTFIVEGDLTGLGKIDLSGNGTLEIGGNMSVSTFIAGTGGSSTVIFNGTTQNIVNGYQFNNMQAAGSGAATVNFEADETVNLCLSGTGTVDCGIHTLSLAGNMSVKNFNAGTGTVNLTGYMYSQSQNINGYSFYNLSVENNGTYLLGNVSISHILNFISGDIFLGANNLTIATIAQVTWKGSITVDPTAGYVATTGSGHLTMTATPALTVFPVGYSSSEYNPVTLTSAAGNVAFDISVSNGVTDANGAAVSSSAVNETWLIIPHSSAPSVSILPQWTDGSKGDPNQELYGFNRSLAQVNARISTAGHSPWTAIGPTGSATGSDPWSWGTPSASVLADSTYHIYLSSPPVPLPVTLVSFDALYKGSVVNLSWETVSEINNDRFEIERSANGTEWTTIGKVSGHGNTQQENTYSAVDNLIGMAAEGTFYYRLKQVDFNSNFSYSEIRSVNVNAIPAAIAMYPNPVSNKLNISITMPDASGAYSNIRIINLNGVAMYNTVVTGSGIQQTLIDMSAYPIGNYLIQVINNNGTVISKTLCKE